MAILTKIDVKPGSTDRAPAKPAPPRSLSVKLDVGRTLALTAIALVILVLAAILYGESKDAAGMGFFALGEAVLVSGFGIAVGSQAGAHEAAEKLGN